MLTIIVVFFNLTITVFTLGKFLPLKFFTKKFFGLLTKCLRLLLLYVVFTSWRQPSPSFPLIVENERFDVLRSSGISSKHASGIYLSSPEKCVSDCDQSLHCMVALTTADLNLYYSCLHFEHPPAFFGAVPCNHSSSLIYLKKSIVDEGSFWGEVFYFLSPHEMTYVEAVEFCDRKDFYQLAHQWRDSSIWTVLGSHMVGLVASRDVSYPGIFFNFVDADYKSQQIRQSFELHAVNLGNISGRLRLQIGLVYKAFNYVVPIKNSSAKAFALCQGDFFNIMEMANQKFPGLCLF
ncbi:uncharacterized protein LOC108665141 [Hyalella azteca]|uniref:Uncharacterized protein LOC108665141 n=1 Tax=Hyalella azteca TaxID=294128 RepID=A0A8B7N0K3_HYAAZ|nr:uncharacterized protein LOC108665141 [Hyalella azteca]